MSAPVLRPDHVEQERQRQARALVADQGEGWEAACQPGSLACHELLDRAALLADLVDRYLLAHPACVANAEWYLLAEQAATALRDLYQRVGAAHLSAEE
jgi:hypothetical protein